MTDEADEAEALQEQALDHALATVRANLQHPEAEATGECLYCGKAVAPPRRWCNAECRNEYQAHVLSKKV